MSYEQQRQPLSSQDQTRLDEIKKFFSPFLDLEPSDETILSKINLLNILMAIAGQDQQWFEDNLVKAKLSQNALWVFYLYTINTSKLVKKLIDVNYSENEAVAVKDQLEAITCQQATSPKPYYDPEIRRMCKEYVSEINTLEEEILRLEKANKQKTPGQNQIIHEHLERIDQLLSFLYQDTSIKHMELNDEQRAFLGSNFFDGFNEGLPSKDMLVFRTRKVIELANISNIAPKILVNSPPYSGKTSMTDLLRFYLTIVKGRTVIPIRCPTESPLSYDLLFSCITSQHANSLASLCKTSDPSRQELVSVCKGLIIYRDNIDLILDDAQRIYGVEDFWWGLKSSRKRIFCFSSYSINTACIPFTFDKQLPVSFLLFTRDEFNKSVSNFVKQTKDRPELRDVCVKERIRDHQEEVYRSTSGYPGLVIHGLRLLTCEYPKDDEKFNRFKFYENLCHPGSAGCFKLISEIEEKAILKYPNLGLADQEAIKLMICKCLDTLITFRRLSPYELTRHVILNSGTLPQRYLSTQSFCLDIINTMIRMCVIYQDPDSMLQFAIPLFEFHYMKQLCSILYSYTAVRPTHIEETAHILIQNIVKSFDKNRLKLCNKTSSRQYDRLVYYSLCNIHIGSICPLFQSKDENNAINVGYFLDGQLNCVIEIIAGGDNFEAHCARADPETGVYKHLNCSKYIIIDFYECSQASTRIKTLEKVKEKRIKDYFVVQFNDLDYNTCTIWYYKRNNFNKEPREEEVVLY